MTYFAHFQIVIHIFNEVLFSIKPIIQRIRDVSKSFDYIKMIEFTLKESLYFEDENIRIKLAFWPRTSSQIDGMNRAVGLHGYFDSGFVNPSKAISKAIEEKARKYGNPILPFVITLNCISPYHFSQDDLEILIGKDYEYIKSNKPIAKDVRTFHNGIFSNSFMKNVAALLITWVTPYHRNDEQWYWCENPNFENKEFQKNIVNQIF